MRSRAVILAFSHSASIMVSPIDKTISNDAGPMRHCGKMICENDTTQTAQEPDRFDKPIFEALLTPYRSWGGRALPC